MTRHKSRVARRRRHRARRGTRKQSGGMFNMLARLFDSKPANGAEAAAPGENQSFLSKIFGYNPNSPTPPPTVQNLDTAVPPGPPGPLTGGRKTRHRRRRSPRRHRK